MKGAFKDSPGFQGGQVQFSLPPWSRMVRLLVIANAAIFFGCFALDLASPSHSGKVFDLFGLTPRLWSSWFPLLPVWQLGTYGFLHSVGSLGHILFNMLFLYFLGTMLEDVLGGRRFLVTYFGAMLVGAVATLVAGLLSGTQLPTIGASGAIMGVVVALASLRPNQRILFLLFPITLKTLALIYVGMDVFYGLKAVFQEGGDRGVSYTAHLGGAAYGFIAVRAGWIWSDPMTRLEARSQVRSASKRIDDERRLDGLLEQINKQGIQSLSSGDRAFLKRMSARK